MKPCPCCSAPAGAFDGMVTCDNTGCVMHGFMLPSAAWAALPCVAPNAEVLVDALVQMAAQVAVGPSRNVANRLILARAALLRACVVVEDAETVRAMSEMRSEVAALRVQRDEAVAELAMMTQVAQKATLEFGTLAVEHAKQANGERATGVPEAGLMGPQKPCWHCGQTTAGYGPSGCCMDCCVQNGHARPPAAPPVAEADGQRRHWTEKRTTSIDPDYRREPKTDLFCCRCQKDIAGETGIKGVHLCSDALHMAIHPEDAGPSDDIHPLGAECARKIPREYIVDFKWSATTAAPPVAEDADAHPGVRSISSDEILLREVVMAAMGDRADWDSPEVQAAVRPVRARMTGGLTAEALFRELSAHPFAKIAARIEDGEAIVVSLPHLRAALSALQGGGK